MLLGRVFDLRPDRLSPGFRFPAEVIVAVRWYLRYGLSYRDVEELLAERGIEVDHVKGQCADSRRIAPRKS